MAGYADTFERKEVKYRLNAGQRRFIEAQLAGHMELDAYGRSRVTSIYFDTPTHDLICRSIEKPLYKEKLRLRFYGELREDACVFLELKKKFRGIVYKRRVACSYAAARAFMGGMPYSQACRAYPLPDEQAARASLSPHSLQIVGEIDAFIERHRPLEPSMVVSCDRSAYAPVAGQVVSGGSNAGGAPTGQASLRITFDADIVYQDLNGPASRAVRPLLAPGEAIMELKSAGAYPLWLVRALDECAAYPTSFSKVGEAFKQCVAQHDQTKEVFHA